MIKTLLVLILGALVSCSQRKKNIHPIKKDLVQAVYASGKIYPRNAYNVLAKVNGYVDKIYVQEGQQLQIGQPLLSIRNEISEKNLKIAQNQLEWTLKNKSEQSPLLKALQEELQAAWSKYVFDSLNYHRQSQLLNEKATTEFQVEQAKTQLDVSKRNYQRIFNQLEQTKKQLDLEYRNALLQYQAQQSNLGDYVIRSTISGKVYDITVKEGDLVNSTTLLMVIGDSQAYEVELQVDEVDISKIKKEQSVYYETDMYPNEIFQGQILYWYERVNPTNKTCRVIASIDPKGRTFFSGMSIEANIIIHEKKQVWVIPKDYLWNQTYVISNQGDTIKIQKGIEDLEYVEVISGLSPQQEIVKP